MMIQDEMSLRNDRAIDRRIKSARFRDEKRLEDFDFSFNDLSDKEKEMAFHSQWYLAEKYWKKWQKELANNQWAKSEDKMPELSVAELFHPGAAAVSAVNQSCRPPSWAAPRPSGSVLGFPSLQFQ